MHCMRDAMQRTCSILNPMQWPAMQCNAITELPCVAISFHEQCGDGPARTREHERRSTQRYVSRKAQSSASQRNAMRKGCNAMRWYATQSE
eukprot:5604741-Pyramimonas_sp.AAC.1